MRPVVFDGCFGWLHPGEAGAGVVLCNPFGYDALCTHRSWRKLAERIAAAGMPALRFDYPGTGDSAGAEEDPQRIDAWLAAIDAAVRRLREWTGVSRVSLVGLRLGGTLAALAAQRSGDIDGLALLAPPITGRRYIRELRAHRQSWLSTSAGMSAAPLGDEDRYLEAFGFGLHGDDIGRLAEIDLRRDAPAPARRVLLLDSSGGSLATELAAQYAANGVALEHGGFDESDRLMVEALHSREPVDAFARVSAWLRDACAHGERPAPARRRADPTPRLALDCASERPAAFGACFGIHCEPAAPRAEVPAVLLVNTGAAHHIGDGRIAVLLARRLAALGVASLRMDLGGLGDSARPAESLTLDLLYSDALRRDAAAGADWLAARGHARIVAFGVCGGAFVSLHVCRSHPLVVGAYGVNLQKFIWDGAARDPGSHRFSSSKSYRRAVFTPQKWKKALLGQSHNRPLRIAAVLIARAARRGWRSFADAIERRTGWTLVPNNVHAMLRAIDAKGVRLRLAYGEYDAGLEEARLQLGRSFAVLRPLANIDVAVLPGLDHALFTRDARDAVIADAQRWLFAELVDANAGSATAESASASTSASTSASMSASATGRALDAGKAGTGGSPSYTRAYRTR